MASRTVEGARVTGCWFICQRTGSWGRTRNMAARTRLPLLFPKNLPPFRNQRLVQTEAAAKDPAYPPIVPSRTAKSKSALRRQVEEHVQKVRASPVEEKLALITRIQRQKFVVYPQTFARDADRWYQHFTKTAYIPGMPEKFTRGQEHTGGEEGSPPAAAQTTVPGIENDAFADIRSLISRVILQEHWYQKKRRPFLFREQEHMVGPLLRNLVSGLTYSLAKYNPLLPLCSLGMDEWVWSIKLPCHPLLPFFFKHWVLKLSIISGPFASFKILFR